jgi:transposase
MILSKQQNPEAVVKEIRRQTRRKFSTEEKIRIVLEGLRGVRRQTNLDTRW